MANQYNEANYILLQAIVAHSTSCIAAKDLGGHYLFVNHEYERLFNVATEDFLGKTDEESFPQDIAQKFRAADLEVIKSKKVIFVEEKVPVNGGINYYLSAKFPIFDKQNTLIATGLVATDITERKHLEERLKQLAETDPLTNVANRRKIFDTAEKERMKSKRYQLPLSLIMVDIDHFKKTNDIMGHAYGDQVVESIASICLKNLRDVDEIGRIGGDEFLIVLPNTRLTGALQLAHKLVQKVQENSDLNNKTSKLSATISTGVAELSARSNSIAALVNAADRALYKAKKSGRNRACSF
ncbi:MAG: GGDEF domain-containing protein [Pseudomonadales bacterium]|nr:GGDEF domain-containing protein [Pseudomonadales bacterium]